MQYEVIEQGKAWLLFCFYRRTPMTAPLFCNSAMTSDVETPAAKIVRILVADDHDIVCAGLERMIAAQPDMEVCGMAGSGTEAVEKALSLKPDVVILDMNMSGLNGLEATREIRKELPECEVLLFTGLETDELMRQAFVSGAKSFILKSDARTHLLEAIRALAQHKPYFTNKVSEVIFARLLQRGRGRDSEAGRRREDCRRHELEIVRRLALGDSNREVAREAGGEFADGGGAPGGADAEDEF
jgi:two-component system response regulator NreC